MNADHPVKGGLTGSRGGLEEGGGRNASFAMETLEMLALIDMLNRLAFPTDVPEGDLRQE